MALLSIYFQLLYLLASCVTIGRSCRAVQCKLLPSAPDIFSEFQSMASEKGVRIVYLNLIVGNDSSARPLDLDPDVFRVYLPERWVWANSISEPMLALPYDYDIFSLGLLNIQVRSISVHLDEEPIGCLASLNSSCQLNNVVGKALFNVTRKSSTDEQSQKADVVCVAIRELVDDDLSDFVYSVRYHCCEADERKGNDYDESTLHCDQMQMVQSSKWFVAFSSVEKVATVIAALFFPAFLFVLPEVIVMNIEDEIKKEANYDDNGREGGETAVTSGSEMQHGVQQAPSVNEDEEASVILDENDERLANIPVDDTSPITCCVFLQKCADKLPRFQLSFNVKLLFLVYGVFPFILYIVLLLSSALKGNYLKEAFRTNTRTRLDGYAFWLFYMFHEIGIVFLLLFIIPPFLVVVSLKPKNFIENVMSSDDGPHIYSYTRTVGQRIRMDLLLMQDKVYWSFSSSSQLYSNGLRELQDCTIGAFLKKAKFSHHLSRTRRALCVFCVLFFSLFGLLLKVVFGGIVLAILLVKSVWYLMYLSPTVSLLLFVLKKIAKEFARVRLHVSMSGVFLLFITLLAYTNLLHAITCVYFIAIICCQFVIKVIIFTLMGLILNANIVTPYVVFLLVAVTNVYLCYANLQNRYKEVKRIISEQWQKHKGLLQGQFVANSTDETVIPRKLFWFVCSKDIMADYTVLPIQTEIFVMFRNIICILAFLFLSLSSVIFFGNLYQISTVVSSIAVFLSGVIPKLVIQGLTKEIIFSGWEKIKITRRIEKSVKKYIDDVNNGETPGRKPEERALAFRDDLCITRPEMICQGSRRVYKVGARKSFLKYFP